MKIAKLTKRLKKCGKHICKFTDYEKNQWIGTAYGIYPLYNMPELKDDSQILTLLDIPINEHNRYHITELGSASTDVFNNYIKHFKLNEFKVFDNNFLIDYGGDQLMCLQTDDGIKLINTADLEIMDLLNDSETTMYYKFANGMIILSNGFVIAGIITCHTNIGEELVHKYKQIYELLLQAYQTQIKRDKEIADESVSQIDFDSYATSK